ncbi:MAG: hypothetical protein ABIX00_09275 [Polaromonas sp.]
MMKSAFIRRTFCGATLALAAGASYAQVSNLGDAINQAGCQRMAQFYLANTCSVDTAVSQREMAKAREEFIPALELLRNAPEASPEIRQTLVLADGQGLFFDTALKARVNSPKAASDVFVTSENLLQVMDRVTSLYARILG